MFGARARRTARADSDLDVAVLFSPGLDGRGRHEATLDVLDALAAGVGALGERAHVLDRDAAGAVVAFTAVRDGVCVVDRGDGVAAQTVARIARRYDDDAWRRAIRVRHRPPAADARMYGSGSASLIRRLLALQDAQRELERPLASVATALLGDPVLRAAVERWLVASDRAA